MLLQRATWLHLRLPFSFLLMPVFWFGAALVPPPMPWGSLALMFFILHGLVYPASNAFNSYYDRDEESIGGLEKPPPVSKELLWTAQTLDGLALLLSLGINMGFMWSVLAYILVSRAYSYDKIRLKKLPITSWLVVGFFQGGFIVLSVVGGLTAWNSYHLLQGEVFGAIGLSTLMFWGSYPMTQVYQHQEDARRGDRTISRLLGIRGTFLFTLTVFGLAVLAYTVYFFPSDIITGACFCNGAWAGIGIFPKLARIGLAYPP
ncbi:MAG: UbiA family prenyltransferase, partial [Microscillaceae bacterium]|nr:UbiA family prenyltransferase [Microscillaceae bacterium]